MRPKLFTIEPSYVAITFILVLAVWYPLSCSKLKHLWLAVATAWSMWIIGSPIGLGGIIAISVATYLQYGAHRPITKSLFLTLIAVVGIFVGWSTFGGRLSSGRGVEGSTNTRIFFPYKMAAITISEYPLLGVGMGQLGDNRIGANQRIDG